MHFVSAACRGEICTMCREPATHKVGEEQMFDDPSPYSHNMTAYICCRHFGLLMKTVCQPAAAAEGAMSHER